MFSVKALLDNRATGTFKQCVTHLNNVFYREIDNNWNMTVIRNKHQSWRFDLVKRHQSLVIPGFHQEIELGTEHGFESLPCLCQLHIPPCKCSTNKCFIWQICYFSSQFSYANMRTFKRRRLQPVSKRNWIRIRRRAYAPKFPVWKDTCSGHESLPCAWVCYNIYEAQKA